MREHFESIKQQVNITDVAHMLGLTKQGKMYKHPNERTASICIYPKTQSFCDFGRNQFGDCIRLWSYIRGVDNWQALQEIADAFNIRLPDKRVNVPELQQAERQRQMQLQRQQLKQEQWRRDVDLLKAQIEMYEALAISPHVQPLSDIWCTCMNRLTTLSGQLDLMCGIY